jgi:threonine synthase
VRLMQRTLFALESISKEANLEIPDMVKGLFSKKISQDTIINKEDIEKEILKFL